MDDEQEQQGQMVLVRSSFPVTGQPIRVVMIDGEPWFVTADVCRVLGRRNPSDTIKGLESHQHRTVDLRAVTLHQMEGYDVPAGQKPYRQGNPLLGVVSEAGLYSLLMRSDKKSARPFRAWVTDDLLPSIRRGDTDIPTQQRRMAETLTEAIGQQVRIVAEIDHEDWPGLTVHSDGTVHCRHGEMILHLPGREEDSGPPFGAYFACPGGERVGIRGSRVVPGCPKLKLVDLIRLRREARSEPKPAPSQGTLIVEMHGARIYGTAPQVAELMREYGG
ncbi:Bro-N domain-containing protein [Streptomyces sp. FH025]|uniref:BRO-N domain-containing protein n=1 Tax=Streptomyces sp. FH025 TaxID=2815937 RepID=UPI001A9D1DDF|nr:Bro-N domain-containing protein [Streptomyces sp. FH025]MBO1416911.1 Bro-N domain-containing protein [Streptomyces sp. FH025]